MSPRKKQNQKKLKRVIAKYINPVFTSKICILKEEKPITKIATK